MLPELELWLVVFEIFTLLLLFVLTEQEVPCVFAFVFIVVPTSFTSDDREEYVGLYPKVTDREVLKSTVSTIKPSTVLFL